MNQAELIERINKGDRSVFSDIVEQLQKLVYNTALSIVQIDADAEDITQEVFIMCLKTLMALEENHNCKHGFTGLR